MTRGAWNAGIPLLGAGMHEARYAAEPLTILSYYPRTVCC